jgi:hypothetical protein
MLPGTRLDLLRVAVPGGLLLICRRESAPPSGAAGLTPRSSKDCLNLCPLSG